MKDMKTGKEKIYFLVETEDFWEFLDLAVEKASENEQKQKEENKWYLLST